MQVNQLCANDGIDVFDGIEAIHVNLARQKLNAEVAFQKVDEADHTERVNDTAGDKWRGISEVGGGRTVQKILCDVGANLGLDGHSSVFLHCG